MPEHMHPLDIFTLRANEWGFCADRWGERRMCDKHIVKVMQLKQHRIPVQTGMCKHWFHIARAAQGTMWHRPPAEAACNVRCVSSGGDPQPNPHDSKSSRKIPPARGGATYRPTGAACEVGQGPHQEQGHLEVCASAAVSARGWQARSPSPSCRYRPSSNGKPRCISEWPALASWPGKPGESNFVVETHRPKVMWYAASATTPDSVLRCAC